MSDERKPEQSQWWKPPKELSNSADFGPIGAVLLVLVVVGWAIVGLFKTLLYRSKSFGLRELFFLMTGVAVLLALVALALN